MEITLQADEVAEVMMAAEEAELEGVEVDEEITLVEGALVLQAEEVTQVAMVDEAVEMQVAMVDEVVEMQVATALEVVAMVVAATIEEAGRKLFESSKMTRTCT
jgi:sigma54-dependent transcription regulator